LIQVAFEEGQSLAKKLDCSFLEISSDDQRAVDDMFANIFEEVKERKVKFR
jgi:hypothetical protein